MFRLSGIENAIKTLLQNTSFVDGNNTWVFKVFTDKERHVLNMEPWDELLVLVKESESELCLDHDEWRPSSCKSVVQVSEILTYCFSKLKDGEIKLKIVKRECIVLEEKAMHHHCLLSSIPYESRQY